MPIATVHSDAQAEMVIRCVIAELEDWSSFWPRFAKRLPAQQKRVWSRRFGLGLTHSGKTVKRRATRKPPSSYYAKNAPNSRARPSAPYYEWTGSLRESTQQITGFGPKAARIEPDRNYDGPIKVGEAFSTIVGRRVPDDRVWDVKHLERIIEPEIERWISSVVLPTALTKCGGREVAV